MQFRDQQLDHLLCPDCIAVIKSKRESPGEQLLAAGVVLLKITAKLVKLVAMLSFTILIFLWKSHVFLHCMLMIVPMKSH